MSLRFGRSDRTKDGTARRAGGGEGSPDFQPTGSKVGPCARGGMRGHLAQPPFIPDSYANLISCTSGVLPGGHKPMLTPRVDIFKPRQHLVYLSVHFSRPCWIGGRPLISMLGLSHDEDTFCLYAAPLLVKPRLIE